jgi:hypothetical protein
VNIWGRNGFDWVRRFQAASRGQWSNPLKMDGKR